MARKKRGDEINQKGDRTRAVILKAARNIFSRYPYHVASFRMIGKEAGIDHSLISYYFPNKEKLFEVVLADLCDEYVNKIGEWLGAIRGMNGSEGFLKYLDYWLNYTKQNPEPAQILALNFTRSEDITRIPGHHYLTEYLERNHKIFKENIALKNSPEKITMFFNSFSLLLFAFVGMGSDIARIQGIEPGSPRYRKLVKDTLAYIFIPRFKEILRGTGKKRK